MSDCSNSRCEPYSASDSVTPEKKLITIALQLVSDHYDKNDEGFDKSCIELEKWCYAHGKAELAEYAMANRCPACAFIPM